MEVVPEEEKSMQRASRFVTTEINPTGQRTAPYSPKSSMVSGSAAPGRGIGGHKKGVLSGGATSHNPGSDFEDEALAGIAGDEEDEEEDDGEEGEEGDLELRGDELIVSI